MGNQVFPPANSFSHNVAVGLELHPRVGKIISRAHNKTKHTEGNRRPNMENLSHSYDHFEVIIFIGLPIITLSNKENKDEEFLSFLHLSIGLFLSDASVLTPKPWKTLTWY